MRGRERCQADRADAALHRLDAGQSPADLRRRDRGCRTVGEVLLHLVVRGSAGHRSRELIGNRPWLTVFRFPTYTPDLNPAEGVWGHLMKSLGNLAPCSIDDLAGLVRTRLKRMRCQPDLLDGFIAETGLITTPP
ncbi:hypothetical protein AB0D57_36550 [Streptomyces sp. NPDC048275]|uniref:hypothetical protein n=1 Tax=Streptomyces sp. NPDC048275 TaxID=3155629 RepID=UPI00340E1894